MTVLSREKITDLVVTEAKRDVCLSLFMPMQRGPDKTQENRIRLKNLYKRIEEKLSERDVPSAHAEQFLDSVGALLENGRLPSNSDGMALFSKEDDTRVHFLPRSFAERVVIDNQFYIKPLLPLLTEDRDFYLLTLSQKKVRLYKANQEKIEEIIPDDLPQSMDEALAFEDPEKRQQYHTSTDSPHAPGNQPASFHTHNPEEEKKNRIRRFFQQVNASVSQHLAATNDLPMILAGVDYLLPIYREVNSYAHLLDKQIKGNPENLADHELQAQAWEIVRHHFSQAWQDALEKFNTLRGSDRVSTDLDEIVVSAHYGRVDTLFTAEDQERWGTFNEKTGQIQKTEAGEHELTNLASRHTLLNSGTVYILPATNMPEGGPLAAILRYTVDP